MTTKQHIISIIAFVVLYSVICITGCQAQDIDINKIIRIESSGRADAWNHLTDARGLCQLREIAWKDVINHNPGFKVYHWDEHSFDPVINILFAEEYFKIIKGYLKHYGLEEIKDRPLLLEISCYNWGIGNVVKWYKEGHNYDKLPSETKKYYEVYMQGL